MGAIRFGGIASGLDTEQIVKDLMKVERTKVDKLEQDKTLNTWRQEAYNALNKDYGNFILDTKKDFGLTTTTSTGTLINSSVSNISWAKGATSANESITIVSASAGSVKGNFDVNVKQLAGSVTMASVSNITTGVDTTTLANQFTNISAEDVLTFTLETSKNPGAPQTFTFSGTDSITDVVKQINDANLGITAVYDSNIDRFFLQTDDTGKSNEISINQTVGNLFENLNLSVTYYDYADPGATLLTAPKTTQALSFDGTTYKGADAVVDFAGATDINFTSNQFVINGINFDTKSTGSTTVSIDTDVDSVYNKIKSFVDKYNTLIDKVGSKLSEKQYRDFKPLTAEQRESMSESDIELWEEKAKSGLIRNDGLFSKTVGDMRAGFYDTVTNISGSFSNIFDIGVTTEKYSSGTVGGKLEINETKLKDAIRDDVDGVLELLFKQPDSTITDEVLKEKDSGIVTRLYDNMVDGMKGIINKAGPGNDSSLFRNVQSNMLIDFITEHGSISMIDENVLDIDERISDMNDYLGRLEDSYWRRFTAMEKALSQMQSQGDWLTSQLGM